MGYSLEIDLFLAKDNEHFENLYMWYVYFNFSEVFKILVPPNSNINMCNNLAELK